MKKTFIAVSGGVDSSVAAALIMDKGIDCVGGTMKISCGLEGDAEDAARVCAHLGIPHHVFDLSQEFEKEVVCRFVDAYEKALTPNPCIECNRYIKFGVLLDKALALGCDSIATGHYARIEKEGDRYLIKKGADETKDQSYVLWSLSQEQLSRTLLPLGSLTKAQVREIASARGFENAQKSDSQDICFVPDGDYAGFIERYTGKNYPAGDFVDMDGNVLGKHRGIIRYTIGQRKGLGLALPAPMYVFRKEITTNRVVLCENDQLFCDTLYASDFNWVAFAPPDSPFRANVKTRYKAKEAPATVTPLSNGRVKIVFDEPQRAITAGQAAVVYIGDTLIGGGQIE